MARDDIMTVQEFTRHVVIEVLVDVMGEFVDRKLVEKSVMAGDPGEWAPGALATITTEHGLPNPNYEDYDLWEEANDPLETHGVYFEIINMAIIAIYPY